MKSLSSIRSQTLKLVRLLWRRATGSQWIAGAIAGLLILLAWYAMNQFGRLKLLALGGVAVLVASFVFQFPVAGAVMAAFIISSNFATFLPSVTSPILILATSAVLARRILKGDPTVRITRFFMWSALFLAWQITSGLWAQTYDHYSAFGFIRLFLIVFAFTQIVNTPKQLVFVVLGAGCGLILSAILVARSAMSFWATAATSTLPGAGGADQARFFGNWGDPNISGLSAVPIIGLCIAVLRSRVALWQRVMAAASIVAGLVVVLLSLSRGALVGLFVVILITALSDKRRWLLLASAAGAVALFVSVTQLDILGRIGTLAEGRGDASIAQRSEMFWNGLELIQDSFPLGVGQGEYITRSVDYNFTLTSGLVSHNAYVDVFGETGVIGIVLFLGAHLAVYRSIRARRWRISPDEWGQTFAICMFSAYVFILLQHAYGSYAGYPLYWFVLTLMSIRPLVFSVAPAGSAASEKPL